MYDGSCTEIGMVVVVFINLAFKSLVTLFGLCGGWGEYKITQQTDACRY